jgi:hypothetical protein
MKGRRMTMEKTNEREGKGIWEKRGMEIYV